MAHPKDRPNRSVSRREFLRRSAMAGIALPSAAAILAACGSDNGGSSSGGGSTGAAAPFQLARPDNPVTWPATGNPMIPDGQQPETGPLKIFGYNLYIWKKILNKFTDENNVDIEYTVFDTSDEMVEKIRSGAVEADLIVSVTPDNVGKLATAKLIQPINHTYIPNFEANVLDIVKDPFWDQGRQFTMPYTVYSTGIAIRNDVVKTDVANMDNPYEIHWDATYSGQSHLLNGSRDPLAMTLLKNGITDVNTSNQADLDKIKQDLLDGEQSMNWKFDHVDYTEITSGASWAVHQAWSGQAAYYQYYLPKGLDISAITYIWPPKDGTSGAPGIMGSDHFAIPRVAQSPVLAHMMINFMLDPKNATPNYSYEGYQPPLKQLEPDKIVAQGLIPPSQKNIIITEGDLSLGVNELELAPAVNQQWQSIANEVGSLV
jgi:spermidine/putrescine transport system substrate-binding protein